MTAKLKAILGGIGVIILALMAILIAYGNYQHKAYLESKGVAALLDKQFKDYKAEAEKTNLALVAMAEKYQAEKQTALNAANIASGHAADIQAALEAEKAKTAALSPDSLSGAINFRIGTGQSRPIANGTFSFTRIGANRTLDYFLNGESSEKKYQAERSVNLNLRGALDASERVTGNLGLRLNLSDEELKKCIAAKEATASTLKHLEHSITGTKIKLFTEGAITGTIIIIGLHILGVFK